MYKNLSGLIKIKEKGGYNLLCYEIKREYCVETCNNIIY
jgi:hypothetical protein